MRVASTNGAAKGWRSIEELKDHLMADGGGELRFQIARMGTMLSGYLWLSNTRYARRKFLDPNFRSLH